MKPLSTSHALCVLGLACTVNACTYRFADEGSYESSPPQPHSGAYGAPGEPGAPGQPGSTTVIVTGGDDAADASTRGVIRGQELLVSDPRVIQNDSGDGSERWRFGPMMSLLAGGAERTSAFTEAWLETFAATRPDVERLLLGPWRTLSGCSAGYGAPSACELDLETAPFELLAIVNRVDLAERACAAGGEIRFVYTAVDPVTRAPLDATFIFEFPLPQDRTAADVAAEWHALGARSIEGSYPAALAELTTSLLAGSDVSKAHLRSDEISFAPTTAAVWELRDYALQGGTLVQNALIGTPAATLDGSAALATWVAANQTSVLAGSQSLPLDLQGMTAETTTAAFGWTVPGVDDAVRQAFSAGTCSGCHGGDRIVEGTKVVGDRLPFQQIAGALVAGGYYGDSRGGTTLSTYLDAGNGGPDELARREAVLRTLAGTDCKAAPSTPQYGVHRRRDH